MTLTKIASTGVEDSLRWVLGANGTSDYTFTGPGLTGTVNDPTIYLTRGHTYIFQNNSGGHPFYIKTSIANGGTNDAYNTGVTNNGGGNGTEIVFTVPHDSPDILYYQCSSHASMAGQFNIAGSVADGSISTAKIADDAVNNDKLANSVVAAIAANTAKTSNATHTGDVTGSTSLTIANDAVTSAKIADNTIVSGNLADNAIVTGKIAAGAVTGVKIAAEIDNSHITATANIAGSKLADNSISLAKLEHGTSSNNGKFLRANNGADPTFETVNTDLVSDTSPQLGGHLESNGYDIKIADGDEIKVGTGNDLLIYHTNNQSYVQDNGVGDLTLASNSNIKIMAGDENSVICNDDGSVELYYDNSLRFFTRSNGGTIRGTSTNVGMDFSTDGAHRGTVYANNSNQIGFLDTGGDWAIRHTNDSQTEFFVQTNRKAAIDADGLKFGSDTASANALDDYEEGTHTPVVGASGWNASSTTAVGTYVKVGNICTYHIDYVATNFSSVGMSDYLYVELPFTSKASGNNVGTLMVSYWAIGSQSISWMGGAVGNNTNRCYFHYHNGNNNNTNNATKTNFNNALYFKGTVVYQTA